MLYKFIISLFITFNLFSKNFIVQKPIIFLTKAEKSKYELPVKIENLIKINKETTVFKDNLSDNQRKKLVKYALKFNNTKGKRTKSFRNDCSGFTRKVYSRFNIELFKLPRNELRNIHGKWLNGVELIWKYCKKHGKVFIRKLPKAGDIVFFDNTHDRNKNGIYDDYFTHVGIVIKVDKDKTIHYIHKASTGIKVSKLNIEYENKRKKGKKEINSYLRRRGKYRLSGQLVRGFGSIFLASNITQHHHQRKGEAVTRPEVVTHPKVVTYPKVVTEPKVVTHPKAVTRPKAIEIIPKKYRKKIVKKAIFYLGKKIKKEDFVLKVYSDIGFNILDKEFNDEKHIERAIFWSLKKNGRLFTATKPKVGDLIFFDKLNGKNLFLNIAIIEKVNKNQITFIHALNGIVKRAYLNNKYWKINKKAKKTLNSYFVKNKNSRRKLSSEFFRRFGSIFQK